MERTAVKEHPMLFAGRMAQAVHDGSKTQTRRPVDVRATNILDKAMIDIGFEYNLDLATVSDIGCVIAWLGGAKKRPPRHEALSVPVRHPDDTHIPWDDCGKNRIWSPISPGERIWGRETWGCCGDYDGRVLLGDSRKALYRAAPHEPEPRRWRPSIHMPRWACRTVLEVTNVRVERLQSISEADALADGGWVYAKCPIHKDPIASFRQVWDSIYCGHLSWEANPFVWVYEFKRVTPTPGASR